jgi:hypothetical protein
MKWRVRTLMAGIAVVACLAGLMLGFQRRGDSFRMLAAYHEQAATYLYIEKVGVICTDGFREGDFERTIANRGEEAWHAYQAARYHDCLVAKYVLAAKRPWLPVMADPPPPLGANPKIDYYFDPLQYEYEHAAAADPARRHGFW